MRGVIEIKGLRIYETIKNMSENLSKHAYVSNRCFYVFFDILVVFLSNCCSLWPLKTI
jgi:hypothetical protein